MKNFNMPIFVMKVDSSLELRDYVFENGTDEKVRNYYPTGLLATILTSKANFY
jgi:hypothetical protein